MILASENYFGKLEKLVHITNGCSGREKLQNFPKFFLQKRGQQNLTIKNAKKYITSSHCRNI